MGLTCYDIKKILSPKRETSPVDDFRIIDSWTEYVDKPNTKVDERPLEYMCYELEVIDPNSGEKTHFYKAIKFARIIRVPKTAKRAQQFMKMQSQVLGAIWERGINFITIIANIMEPKAIGLLVLYGVQGISNDLEEAKKKAEEGFVSVMTSMQGTFRTLQMRSIISEEAEWLRVKMYNMEYMTVVRGIPKAREGVVEIDAVGAFGEKANDPQAQGTLEEIITGMSDYEYVLEILSTPVYKNTLQEWSTRTERDMTDWYSQLQGTKSFSMNVSMPMMFMSNQSTSEGWNKAYTDADSVSVSQGESFNTSYGESIGQALSESYGQSFGKSFGTSVSDSVSQTHSTSQGTSIGQSFGQSFGQNFNTSMNQSFGEGQSISHSNGFSSGESFGVSQGESYSFGQSQNASTSHNVGTSQSQGITQSETVSHGTSQTVGQTTTNTLGHTQNSSTSVGNTSSVGTNGSHSSSSGFSNSTSIGQSTSHTDGTSVSGGVNAGVSAFGVSIGGNVSTGANHSDTTASNTSISNSTNWGMSDSTGWSSGSSQSNTNTVGSSISNSLSQGTSISQGQSFTHSNGISNSQTFGTSESYGTSFGRGINESWGVNQNISHSNSISQNTSDGWGKNISTSYSTGISEGNSQSVNEGKSFSESVSSSDGVSVGRTVGNSYSESMTESVSKGITNSRGTSQSIGQGQSYSTGQSSSASKSLGSSGAYVQGNASTMGMGPSIGYNNSHQWLDQEVKDILECLEYENERIKRALRADGAFYTYVYFACPSVNALSAAKAVSKSAWQNEFAMTHPVQVLNLNDTEQEHLLYHFTAFSSDVTRESVHGVEEYKYCTVLLSNEYAAYTHLPRVSEGGVRADVEDIPKFSVPSNLKGEIYMGTIISAERYTFKNGYRTPYDYRIDESELMHGIFTGASRSGKTVAATRFISELSQVRRKATGKRLRIICMDPKQDWRVLARFVEPERFNFYSLGNAFFRPIKLNPLKIPKGVSPQFWCDGVIDIYCRAYGLLERGKQMLGEAIYGLYEEAGVFETCRYEGWQDRVSELSKEVTLPKVYKRILQIKNECENPSSPRKAGPDTRDAYTRLLDRLQVFTREYAVETKLFGTSEGMGIDELMGNDDVVVLESKGLEASFRNFLFGIITSGFYKFALAHEGGYLAENQYETVLVIEEANEVFTGNDAAGQTSKKNSGPTLSGQSEFEQILDQAAGYGLFVIAITQKISDMPKSIIANSGMIFAGKLVISDDIEVAMLMLGREGRYEDRDVKKWFPRSPIGWFLCKSSRNFNFLDAEPRLVHIAPLNVVPPTNAEIDELLLQKEAIKLAVNA